MTTENTVAKDKPQNDNVMSALQITCPSEVMVQNGLMLKAMLDIKVEDPDSGMCWLKASMNEDHWAQLTNSLLADFVTPLESVFKPCSSILRSAMTKQVAVERVNLLAYLNTKSTLMVEASNETLESAMKAREELCSLASGSGFALFIQAINMLDESLLDLQFSDEDYNNVRGFNAVSFVMHLWSLVVEHFIRVHHCAVQRDESCYYSSDFDISGNPAIASVSKQLVDAMEERFIPNLHLMIGILDEDNPSITH